MAYDDGLIIVLSGMKSVLDVSQSLHLFQIFMQSKPTLGAN